MSYFNSDEHNLTLLKSTFRGRDLFGEEIQLPLGNVGLVLCNAHGRLEVTVYFVTQ